VPPQIANSLSPLATNAAAWPIASLPAQQALWSESVRPTFAHLATAPAIELTGA
jgi:hypothetical protein